MESSPKSPDSSSPDYYPYADDFNHAGVDRTVESLDSLVSSSTGNNLSNSTFGIQLQSSALEEDRYLDTFPELNNELLLVKCKICSKSIILSALKEHEERCKPKESENSSSCNINNAGSSNRNRQIPEELSSRQDTHPNGRSVISFGSVRGNDVKITDLSKNSSNKQVYRNSERSVSSSSSVGDHWQESSILNNSSDLSSSATSSSSSGAHDIFKVTYKQEHSDPPYSVPEMPYFASSSNMLTSQPSTNTVPVPKIENSCASSSASNNSKYLSILTSNRNFISCDTQSKSLDGQTLVSITDDPPYKRIKLETKPQQNSNASSSSSAASNANYLSILTSNGKVISSGKEPKSNVPVGQNIPETTQVSTSDNSQRIKLEVKPLNIKPTSSPVLNNSEFLSSAPASSSSNLNNKQNMCNNSMKMNSFATTSCIEVEDDDDDDIQIIPISTRTAPSSSSNNVKKGQNLYVTKKHRVVGRTCIQIDDDEDDIQIIPIEKSRVSSCSSTQGHSSSASTSSASSLSRLNSLKSSNSQINAINAAYQIANESDQNSQLDNQSSSAAQVQTTQDRSSVIQDQLSDEELQEFLDSVNNAFPELDVIAASSNAATAAVSPLSDADNSSSSSVISVHEVQSCIDSDPKKPSSPILENATTNIPSSNTVNDSAKTDEFQELKYKQEAENVKEDFKKLLEDELICNICTELLIKPITLGCSHTFCKFCISEWKDKKNQCPMCRAVIATETPCLFLDNFIGKAVEQLDPTSVEKRLEIIKSREELLKNKASKPAVKLLATGLHHPSRALNFQNFMIHSMVSNTPSSSASHRASGAVPQSSNAFRRSAITHRFVQPPLASHPATAAFARSTNLVQRITDIIQRSSSTPRRQLVIPRPVSTSISQISSEVPSSISQSNVIIHPPVLSEMYQQSSSISQNPSFMPSQVPSNIFQQSSSISQQSSNVSQPLSLSLRHSRVPQQFSNIPQQFSNMPQQSSSTPPEAHQVPMNELFYWKL